MNWQDRIVVDPEILVGKPVVKGTRLAVEFIIDLLAQGWTEAEILRNYPGLTLALEMSGEVTPSLQDEFLEGLTYEEYFALSDEEEKALWDRIFAEDETGPYDLEEQEAPTDAIIAARQERSA